MGYYSRYESTTSFPCPVSYLFSTAQEALKGIANLSINASDRTTYTISAEKGMSLFTWGERITIAVSSVNPHESSLTASSTLKPAPINVGYAIDLLGRNKANVNEIMGIVRKVYDANPCPVPDEQMRENAKEQANRIRVASGQRSGMTVQSEISPICICAVPSDQPVAESICISLESSGIPCRIAPRDTLDLGDFFDPDDAFISGCDRIIVVFSRESNNSDRIHHLLTKAVAHGLVVLLYRKENLPLSKELTFILGDSRWIESFEDLPEAVAQS